MYTDIPNKNFLKKYMSPRLYAHVQLARLDRPIGNWLLLLPTLWGVYFASQGDPSLRWVAIFVIGSIAMRSAGCVINDLMDMHIDRQVERTRHRPLAAGLLTVREAYVNLFFFLIIAFMCFLKLPLLAKKICLFALVFSATYPLMKRLTYWPQIFLGLTFSLGILVAGTAIQNKLTLPQLLLYLSGVMWTIFFDTIYAHQDKKDDLLIGVKSTALFLGDKTKVFLGGCALVQIALLSLVGVFSYAPWTYYGGCVVILAHLLAQIFYVNLDDPTSCGRIFRSNHGLGWIIFLNLLFIF